MVERDPKTIEFKEEGVIFEFHGKFDKVWVEKFDLIGVDELPKGSEDFSPKRPVLHFRLYHEDDPDKDLLTFEGTIHLKVYFLQEDINSAGNIENLDLGYHDNSKWVSFKKKYKLEKTYDKSISPWIGYGKVKIKDKMPDPLIGWGP